MVVYVNYSYLLNLTNCLLASVNPYDTAQRATPTFDENTLLLFMQDIVIFYILHDWLMTTDEHVTFSFGHEIFVKYM